MKEKPWTFADVLNEWIHLEQEWLVPLFVTSDCWWTHQIIISFPSTIFWRKYRYFYMSPFKCFSEVLVLFQNVTKERQMKLLQQQNDITGLSRQVKHVMNFTNWAIASGSSTALLYSKRLVRNIVFLFLPNRPIIYKCRMFVL